MDIFFPMMNPADRIKLNGGACREAPGLCCAAVRRRLRHCGCCSGHCRHRRSSRRSYRGTEPDREQDKEPDKEPDSSADPTLPGLSSAPPNSSSDRPADRETLTQTRTRCVRLRILPPPPPPREPPACTGTAGFCGAIASSRCRAILAYVWLVGWMTSMVQQLVAAAAAFSKL